MGTMTLAQALRYKKRLVEKIRKTEGDIQSNNSYMKENSPEVDVTELFQRRKQLVKDLIQLKLTTQTATQTIMPQILELAETKSEIAFWQRVPTTFGVQRDQWGDQPPVEYVATYRKSQVDAIVESLQDKVDSLQTQIDAYNNATEITLPGVGQ